MAQLEDKHVLSVVRRALPDDRIRSLSLEVGFVRRHRKVDVVAFVRALVLGFAGSSRRTLAGLRRGYELGSGQRLAPSSFYARFTPELAALLGRLSSDALAAIGDGARRTTGAFASFREVLAIDSTLVRLHASLASTFPSVWTNHTPASVKLGALINVVGRRPTRLSICPGSRHDIHLLEPGPWMKRRLFVFDLGFFGAALFQRIDLHGGYFLTRMRKHGNPVVLRTLRGTNEPLVGRRLRDVLHSTRSKVIDVEARMVFQEHLDVIKKSYTDFRFVAVFHDATATWHGYVTNAPPDMLAAEHVSAVYAARWEIELLFRELKQRFRIDHVPTRKAHIVLALLHAAVLALVVSRRLHRLVERSFESSDHHLPQDRWALLFENIALAILVALRSRRARTTWLRTHAAMLLFEARDPNRRRVPLFRRAQLGQMAAS